MSSRAVLIVDGYNVLRAATGPYVEVAARDLDAARARLVSDVAAYVQGEGEAIVVFDATDNRHSDGSPHRVAGVTVIFSPFGVSADSVIEQQVGVLRVGGTEITVVTSDAATQWTVLGTRVRRLSARGFAEEIAREAAERAEVNPTGPKRSTVAERVGPEVGERLARWARGQP